MIEKKSGQMKARELASAFQGYLDTLKARGESLPTKANGELHISLIAKESGVGSRERFYTNPALQEMLQVAAKALPKPAADPVAPPPSPEHSKRGQRALETRVSRLEQQNAVLMAENSELRRRVAELTTKSEREAYMYETGRRVAEPPRK